MAGKKSFSVTHPSFVSESFLNRFSKSSSISRGSVISVRAQNGVRKVSDNLKDTEGNDIAASNGHSLVIVKAEVNIKAKDFSFSQVRLVCNHKTNNSRPLKGEGINIYPLGYIESSGMIRAVKLDEVIEIRHNTPDFEFVFDMPDDYFPVWLGFKQNNLFRLPRMSSPSDIQPASSD
jgi:hypothetical protein